MQASKARHRGPEVKTPGCLTPAYSPRGQKEPNEKDIDRHRANDDSGLLSFLKERGIPMYHFRMQTESGKTTLTARCAWIMSTLYINDLFWAELQLKIPDDWKMCMFHFVYEFQT